jgi:ubiquinone/menaquinone biosynthesis C-methylase UbiE
MKSINNSHPESHRDEFWSKVYRAEFQYLVERMKGCRNVLSIGCGPAVIEAELVEHGFSVTGVDVSKEALICEPDGRRTMALSIADMSLPNHSFDAAICVASLQFIDDYRQALEKITRALRPGGRIIVMLLNPSSAFFKERSHDPSSYIAKIKHINLKEITAAIAKMFTFYAEYFLRVEGSDVYGYADEPDAALFVVVGTKRRNTEKQPI